MFSSGLGLFTKTKELNAKITEFLNNISECSSLFKKACDCYLIDGDNEEFENVLHKVVSLEARNDTLRREIEAKLYEHTLIPESRADVLELLEGLDKILSMYEAALYQVSIEKVEIAESFVGLYLELVESVVNAVEALIRASVAFFINIEKVKENIQNVMFFEKQGDMVSIKLKKMIFDAPRMELSHKIQLRMLSEDIDEIADVAEDIADQLSIYVIKRNL